ncbi:OmpA family protein [Qipengyuania sp. ASV99]|uniref:OmpA family protein n=1 Tax=Qipengyuania sp. ASV99 TaxID=3399681 RepID=UPI003A4C8147
MQIGRLITALAGLVALSACEANPEERPDGLGEPTASPAPAESAGEVVSILRPDIQQPDLPPPPIEPLRVTIGFPEGGAELDAAAQAALEALLTSEQIGLGGPISLAGHTDSDGSDAVNERASRNRAETVRDWLVANGIAEARIKIVAFGEQNPAEPNALPDGSPDEAGRSANRRVEIEVPALVQLSTEGAD